VFVRFFLHRFCIIVLYSFFARRRIYDKSNEKKSDYRILDSRIAHFRRNTGGNNAPSNKKLAHIKIDKEGRNYDKKNFIRNTVRAAVHSYLCIQNRTQLGGGSPLSAWRHLPAEGIKDASAF